MDDCIELESDPRMVAAARHFVRERLRSWECTDHLDAVLLVASELVTNAVLHARSCLSLRLTCVGGTVRVEVFDENSRVPSAAGCPPDATSGRGLGLVSALASKWGIEQRPGGKVVWAEIGPGETACADDCVHLAGAADLDEAFEMIRRSQQQRVRD